MNEFEQNLLKSRRSMGINFKGDKNFPYRPEGFPVIKSEIVKSFYLNECRKEHWLCCGKNCEVKC